MFYCQPDMTSSSVLRQGTLHTLFHDRFWKSDHDFQFMIHINFLATMHSFRDNEVVLPTGYDVIVSPPKGGTSRDFFMTDSERAIMTSWYWSIVTFYLQCMVSDITRFFASRIWRHRDFTARGHYIGDFLWRILKERPWLPDSVP